MINIPKYKVGDVVKAYPAEGQPLMILRINEVVNQRGWVGNPTPSYVATDISHLFGIKGYFIVEENIIESIQ